MPRVDARLHAAAAQAGLDLGAAPFQPVGRPDQPLPHPGVEHPGPGLAAALGPFRDRGPGPAQPAHRHRDQPGPLGVGQPVGLAEHRDPGRHVQAGERRVPVGRSRERRPVAQRLDDVDQPGPGPGQVEVDQRVRLRAARAGPEDHVLQVDVAVADQLHRPIHPPGQLAVPARSGRRLKTGHGLVVPQLQLGQRDQGRVGQRVTGQRPVRHLARQVAEHLPVLRIDAEHARGPLEADRLQVAQQCVHGGGVRAHRAPDGPAHPDDALGHIPPDKRDFGVFLAGRGGEMSAGLRMLAAEWASAG